MSKAVFIDRDGTLIRHVAYLHETKYVQLLPKVGSALRLLKDSGYQLIIITNQAGVAYGYYSEDDLKQVNQYIDQLLREQGCRIDAWYYCPHHPMGVLPEYRLICHCRKPRGGMLLTAAKNHSIDLTSSYTIGDRWLDAKAGQTGGGTGIMVLTGEGIRDFSSTPSNSPILSNLFSAARWIVSKGR